MTAESEAITLLRPLAFFAQFRDDWLELVYSLATYRETRAGDYLIVEKQNGDEFYIVMSGLLDVEVSTRTGAETVAQLGPGDLLGELCLIGFDRRSASVRANSEVGTLYWEKEALFRLFSRRYEIGYAFMRALAEAVARKLISANAELSAKVYTSMYGDLSRP